MIDGREAKASEVNLDIITNSTNQGHAYVLQPIFLPPSACSLSLVAGRCYRRLPDYTLYSIA